MKEWIRRRKAQIIDEGRQLVDPHKRVVTSAFLLLRTRRISRALTGLRERLERPFPTTANLQWRLNGPVGVRAISEAVLKEGKPDE
jgi:hypothetical protein